MPWTKKLSEKMDELRAARGGKCEWCSATETLEFAHVHATNVNGQGRGGRERYYDIRNHPECYRLLCHECHLAYDRDTEPPF